MNRNEKISFVKKVMTGSIDPKNIDRQTLKSTKKIRVNVIKIANVPGPFKSEKECEEHLSFSIDTNARIITTHLDI